MKKDSNRSLKGFFLKAIKEELENNSSYNLNVTYKEFDDINNSVWRKLAHSGNYSDAINYMKNYLNNNKAKLENYQIGAISWHVGQLYAFNDDYRNAIKFMSMKNVSDTIEPNYQKGTISYLRRDLNGLQKYYNVLVKNDSTGESDKDILKNFIDNFDKPYKETY